MIIGLLVFVAAMISAIGGMTAYLLWRVWERLFGEEEVHAADQSG